MRFAFTSLTPYTRYRMAVRARAAGEVGPAAEEDVITPAEGENTAHDSTWDHTSTEILAPLCLTLTASVCMFVWLAPSAVQDLVAIAEDSVSIRVSWRSPAQPNGPITQYRLQVLVDETLLQDITLTAEMVSQMLQLCIAMYFWCKCCMKICIFNYNGPPRKRTVKIVYFTKVLTKLLLFFSWYDNSFIIIWCDQKQKHNYNLTNYL